MVRIREVTNSDQARTHLVATLREQDVIRSEQVAQAFLTTRREAFVPFFFEQEGFSWIRRTPDTYNESAWIDAIYRDEPLITLVDEHNWPVSSSSAPTVMAMMLEALEIEPGMRVLEIGTGSGYNAALLAQLVGDAALVVSIDIEESLARSAEQALHELVGAVAIHVGDGRLGVSDHAPYHRIIATASAPGIPRAWYDQLAAGGRLVMDLQGSLDKSGFLIINKAADDRAEGYFDPRYLHFMPLRPGESLATRPVARLLRQPTTRDITVEENETTATIFADRAFHWFLQWDAPGISLAKSTVVQGSRAGQPFITMIDGAKETIIQLFLRNGKWSGYQRGGHGLWETVEQTYSEWDSLGRPGQDAYHVQWDQQQKNFLLLLSPASHELMNGTQANFRAWPL
jgi:protein-L-isoaspartate(D-aspartate) O-methyltransferase